MDRLLLVDDDAEVLKGLALLLSSYEVQTAADGQEAEEILNREAIDLVVLDLYMPRLGGLELLERIRGRGMTVPVILVSGRLDLLARSMDMGADDCLAKPFRVGALESKIAGLLASRRDGAAARGDGAKKGQKKGL